MTTMTDSTQPHSLPPPRLERGAVGWMHANLFSNWQSSLLTALSGLALVAAPVVRAGLDTVRRRLDRHRYPRRPMVIGQYNTDAACPDNNCFWRPQAALLMVTMLLGMAWVVAGGGIAKRIAIAVAIALAAFAFLPYSMERMGLDVRILLLANLPALAAGWAIARYTPLGTPRWIAIVGVAVFVLTVLLLRGVDGIPGLEPVSVIYWGGLMLNLLLAVAGIVLSLPIGVALALGRRSRLPVVKLLCVVFIEVFRAACLSSRCSSCRRCSCPWPSLRTSLRTRCSAPP